MRAIILALVGLAVFVTADQDGPAFGRPDGHESRPDDDRPKFGRPDGHERYLATDDPPAIGGNDGHEVDHDGTNQMPVNTEAPIFGRPDGHEEHNDDDDHDDEDDDEDEEDESREQSESEEYYDYESKDSDESVSEFGKPDGHEPLIRCKRPLCDMFCEHGMQTDEMGCQVCRCLENPCQAMDCAEGFRCEAQECGDVHSCKELTAKCVLASPRRCLGPEPMCANACPTGYKLNDEGCMTCTCNPECPTAMCLVACPTGYKTNENGCTTCVCKDETPTESDNSCMGKRCEVGQVCRKAIDDTASCVPKPLCQIGEEMGFMLRGEPTNFVQKCDADGSFLPRQCNPLISECWCVDDSGKEIDGTRTTVIVDEHKPTCNRKTTQKMNIKMYLVVSHHVDVIRNKDTLSATLVDHVSSWLLLEPDFVKLTKMEPQPAAADDSQTLVLVELVVFHDGESDLPSSAEHMRRRMHMGVCDVPVPGGGVMKPQPETIETMPMFEPINLPNHPPDDVVKCFGHRIRRPVLICIGASIGFFILAISIVIFIACRRRKMHRAAAQFRHRQLDNQPSFEKGNLLVENEYMKSEKQVPEGPLDDKVALA